MYKMTNEMGKAYDITYLQGNCNLHRLLYMKFLASDAYDAFSLLDAYMLTSDIRKKMDAGNPLALYKGWKQLWNSIDFTYCLPNRKNAFLDADIWHWMADMYCILQWRYGEASPDIIRHIPAREMYRVFYPLHEAGPKVAVEKLHEIYWEKEKDAQYSLSIVLPEEKEIEA